MYGGVDTEAVQIDSIPDRRGRFRGLNTNKYRLILKAFDNLYSGDGNKSDKIYYRKTHAEINNLLRMFTYYYDYDPEESPYEEMVTAIHEHQNDNWFISYIAGRLEELGA